MYYSHTNSGRPNTGTETLLQDIPIGAGQTSLGCTSYYLDSGYGPLFPFGYGLSYTTFEYSNISLDSTRYGADGTVRVEFDLTNTGKYDATETVQLYVRDLVGSVVRPVKELKRFGRFAVKAGETVHGSFELPVSELAFWNSEMEYTVEKGSFQLWVAGNSVDGTPVEFTVE